MCPIAEGDEFATFVRGWKEVIPDRLGLSLSVLGHVALLFCYISFLYSRANINLRHHIFLR